MDNSITSANHKELLKLLADYMIKDGWTVEEHIPDAIRPYDLFTVAIVADQDHSVILWQIEISYLPISAEGLIDVSILQCYISLANDFPILRLPELYEMITRINTKLPLVGFGFISEFSMLYFKYNMMLSDNKPEVNGLILSNTLSIITYLLSSFVEPLLLVATGERSIEDAINGMEFKDVYA